MIQKSLILLSLVAFFMSGQRPVWSQEKNDKAEIIEAMNRHMEHMQHRMNELQKAVDDVLWYKKGDINRAAYKGFQ